MIKSIEVKKLHGYLDKKIDFKNENYLIGINGSGKTSILKILNSFFNDKDMNFLKIIDFKKIEIHTKINEYSIEKNEENNRLLILTPKLKKEVENLKKELKEKIPKMRDIPEIFITLQTSSIETVICDYTTRAIQNELKKENDLRILIEEYDDLNDKRKIISLIKKNKLVQNDDLTEEFLNFISPMRRTQEILNYEIKKYSTNFQNLYAPLTANFINYSNKEQVEIFSKIENEKNKLRKPLNKFIDILNTFLLDSYKKIIFDDEMGMLKVKTLDEKLELSFMGLSSGEKHLISLFTYLIFKIKESSILLIDEPERSLHIEWQKNFIPQLKKALEDKKIQIIVATHSPYIVKEVERKNLIGLFPYNRDDER